MDAILDRICQYLGGAYSASEHSYTTPTVAGVTRVRRGFDKVDDFAQFFPSGTSGQLTGCQVIVFFPQGREMRKTLPAVTGRKHRRATVELHCYFWSTAPYVEDCQDTVDDVRDALIAKLRADPTCGSGGIEAGQFHVGIPDDNGAGGDIDWAKGVPETVDQGATKQFLLITFELHDLPVG